MTTAQEIRDALESRYPDVTDSEFNIAQSGFAHEHPLIAIAVVLVSSIVLGTTDPAELRLGVLQPIGCIAIAADEDRCLAMLVRRSEETLGQLLIRLDISDFFNTHVWLHQT